MASSSDAFTVEGYEASHSRVYGSGVKMVTDGNDVYFSHIVAEYPIDTWVKGTREGNTITIEGGQPVCEYYDWDTDDVVFVYLVPMTVQIDENQQGTFVPAEENVYKFNVAEDGTLTSADPELLLGLCSYTAVEGGEGSFYWGGYGDRDLTIKPVTAKPVELPTNAEVEHWVFMDEYETGIANVAIVDNDIYVQGLVRSMKDSWVKGTINGDKVTFPSGQYLGYDAEIYYVCYFMGADAEYDGDDLIASIKPEAIFDYDAENKELTTASSYMANGDPSVLFPLYIYTDVTVMMQNRDFNTPPAAPYDLFYNPADEDSWDPASIWVQIPNTDTDGNLLLEDNLYYQVLFDGEPYVFSTDDYCDLPESTDLLPYNFQGYDVYVQGKDHTVYLYEVPEHSIGVRSVYINENGEELYSEAVYDAFDSLKNTFADKEVSGTFYHDLSGRRVAANSKGILIRTTVYTDGTRRHEKVVVR